ncbi:hypothetical protein FAI41_05305 [Acetobacteraceae bacterium]|nr:hypothetical protein FAI41_05305 [Acetobacteraceae bacterium]
MIKGIRCSSYQRKRSSSSRVVKLLRVGFVFSFFMSGYGIAQAANVADASSEEGEDTRRNAALGRKKTISFLTDAPTVPSERIRVKGVGATPAELVSGSRADYLQRNVELGPLGNQKSVLTPFSMMTTTHDVIEDQQLRTIGQTLQYMPSVNLEGRGNGVFRLINRGYESDVEQNSRIDGLNAIITTPYATEQFDSVTVLNGAAASIYGPQSPAGMMLMTQKRPTDKPFFNFNFGYDSNGAPLESLDTSLGKGPVKVRFNYLNQTGQLYTRNSNEWRDLYSGAIDFQVTKHTKLELNGSQYNNAIYGLPGTFVYGTGKAGVSNSLPGAPNTNLPGYGTNDTGMNASTSVGTMVLKHEFTKTIHLKLGGLYEDASRSSLLAQNTIMNSCKEASGPCYQQSLVPSTKADDFRTWSNFAYLNWDVTDPILRIRHHFNVGSTGYSLDNWNPLNAGTAFMGGNPIKVGEGGLYDPSQGQYAPGINSNGNAFGSGQIAPGVYWNNLNADGKGQFKSASTVVQNMMFGDSFDVGDYFTIMGQLAWGWIQEANYNQKEVATKSGNVNGAFDPTVALTFHPTKRFSAYFNWGQDTAPGTYIATNGPNGTTNQTLTDPARSTQYEGAIKYLWRDRFLVTLGGFAMSRPYTIGNSASFLGNQNDMGMEFQVSGSLTKELSMYGGVTYDNARYHCTDYAACALEYGGGKKAVDFTQNSQVVGVAPWQSDFLLDWHPNWLHGISFNSNIHYQGARAANANNTTYADDYVTLDLGMRYITHLADHMVVFRGNIDNVTNQNYWATLFASDQTGGSVGGYSDEVGAPQTWHITASIYF